MCDGLSVLDAITAGLEQIRNLREIGNRIDIHWGLLAAKAAVEIRTNSGMLCIASDLANVVDVLDNFLQLEFYGLRCRLVTNPVGHHHPRIEGRANDRAALD